MVARSLLTFISLICCILLASSDTYAQQPLNSGPAYHGSAQVVVDGIPLFKVIGTSTYPAQTRAKEIAKRIRLLAEESDFDPAALELQVRNGAAGIYAGDEVLLYVFEEDARIEGILSAQLIAKKLYLPKIQKAISNYRYERETRVLVKHGFYALLRTVLLLLSVWAVGWGFKKINLLVEQQFRRKIEELEKKSKKIIRARQLLTLVRTSLRLLRATLLLIVIYLFLTLVLDLFPWTRYFSRPLLSYVINPLVSIGQAILAYLPNLFFLIILVLLLRLVLKITHTFFNEIDRGKIAIPGFYADWAWPTYRIVRVIAIMLGAVVAYPYIPGSGSEAFRGITLLLGILLSLGSTSLIANIIAGYTMTYRRAFAVGDWVKINDNIGTVTAVRLLVTHMRSLKNEEIVIPNSTILNGEVVNYSSMITEPGLILHTTVGIGYEVPWRQVEAMLLMAAERTAGLLTEPKPFVLKKDLGDFGVTYELNAFCSQVDQMGPLYSKLHGNILDVFNDYGVAILTPHYTGDPEDEKLVRQEEKYSPPADREQQP